METFKAVRKQHARAQQRPASRFPLHNMLDCNERFAVRCQATKISGIFTRKSECSKPNLDCSYLGNATPTNTGALKHKRLNMVKCLAASQPCAIHRYAGVTSRPPKSLRGVACSTVPILPADLFATLQSAVQISHTRYARQQPIQHRQERSRRGRRDYHICARSA